MATLTVQHTDGSTSKAPNVDYIKVTDNVLHAYKKRNYSGDACVANFPLYSVKSYVLEER